ncbi:hypothetical protein AGLY_015127 [Aphis glycines]|uniref:DUF8207 domain-containing protein n=1 Tax=Aphis glycines TaxID=307491 RepID=A0A6G0T193_APHGL|nr:hypothetical protein AGLY_015127 [Aphis glycines]
MDKLMVKKYIEDDNKEKSLFEIPSRVLVVGASGCVYKKLKKIFNGISSINIHFSDDDIISVDDCEPNSVVVIDDFLLENQKLIMEYFIRLRSKNISVIYLTQKPSETGETQKSFKKGTNLENETEKMKQLIHLQQNLQKNFKKSDLEHSEMVLKFPSEMELGPNATNYLPTIEPIKSFGIYYNKDFEDHMIGKCMITFENDDIILNGKKYKGTVGLWRLLAHSDVNRPEYYTEDDLKIFKEILIETDSIYQNNDKSTGRAKSSGGVKYISMISNIWKEINEKKRPITKPTTKPIGEGLRQYTDDRIEYRYIDNMKQLTDRLQLIAAKERAGNNNYHNEKLGILHLCKTSMEKIIDTPKGIEYLLLYVTNLPKEVVKVSKDSIIKKIYFISNDKRKGNNIYHDEKLNILNICIREMENLIDIPNNGAHYLYSYVSCLPKIIIKDEAARDHDYFYKDHKDTKTRHEADTILKQKAMERFNAPDTNMNEKIPALLTAYAMKSKRHQKILEILKDKEKNINIEPLSNFDINHFGNNIKNFRGCFMRNDLPIKSWVNECGVLNLNDSTQNGSHWVAWKKMKNKKNIF